MYRNIHNSVLIYEPIQKVDIFMNKRFGNYVLSGVDEDGNLHFDAANEELKASFPSFLIVTESITEELEYELIFKEITELNESFTIEAEKTVSAFIRGALKNAIRKISIPTSYPYVGESYVEKPVFCHYRPDCGDSPNHGGMTLAVMFDENSRCYKFGIAFCNPTDFYCKKVGNEISWKMVSESPLTIPVEAVENVLNNSNNRGCSTNAGLTKVISNEVLFLRELNSYRLVNLIAEVLESNSEIGDESIRHRIIKRYYVSRNNWI